MNKAIAATQKHFESSSGRTMEYLVWHRLFKREFTEFLTDLGATNIQIGKPNHFDMSGFFTHNGQIWYFSVGDLRIQSFKNKILIRAATSYRDFTGGYNQYASLLNDEDFKRQVTNITRVVG